jgi:hypothetical protein
MPEFCRMASHQAVVKTYLVGINHAIVGKCSPQKLSHPGVWKPRRQTLSQLADHISAGHPWMPATLDGNGKRWQVNANHSEVLGLDIDDGLTIDEALAHYFIASHCGLLIESASSKPEHHKFRLVFPLPKPVEGWERIRLCNRYLAHVVGSADPACKDASRFFYGAPGREPYLLQDVTLPPSFVDDAIAWGEALEAEELKRAAIARQYWESLNARGEDTDALLLSALDAISPNCDYNDWIAIGMALHGMGDQWFTEWDRWSAGAASYKPREMQGRWKSFRGSSPAPGVIFGIAKRYGWQFPQKARAAVGGQQRRAASPPTAPTIHQQYSKGARLAAWAQAINAGRSKILDGSQAGGGKSHGAGNVTPQMFGVKRLIYVSSDHRNPTTDTLTAFNGWADLEARHNGLIRDDDGKLRRAQNPVDLVEPPNCSRTGLATVLREKNVSGADTAGRLCGGCHLKEMCQKGGGYSSGYLHQRSEVLKEKDGEPLVPRFRAHPDGLPNPVDSDYSSTVLIWDEPEHSLTTHQTITVLVDDVRAAWTCLTTDDGYNPSPEVKRLFKWLLGVLTSEIKPPRYGFTHNDVVAALDGDVPTDDEVTAIANILTPEDDLEKLLNPTGGEGVDIEDLPRHVRKKFKTKDGTAAEQAEKLLLKNWFRDLVEVLKGERGHLAMKTWGLEISRPSLRHRDVIAAAKAVIFLDATISPDALGEKIGDHVWAMQQQVQQAQNVTFTQVTDLGRLGMQRGADKQRRAKAIAAHYRAIDPTTKVIDFKANDEDGAWWRDSRGSNDFQDCNTLVLIGTPTANLGGLNAEYCCLTGDTDIEPQGFVDFVDRRVRAEMLQAIERPRAHRRPSERIHIVVVSDFDLGIPTNQVEAVTITPAAGSKVERAKAAITKAVVDIKTTGVKVTQQAVAKATGYTQGYISRFRELLLSLLRQPYTESNNLSAPPEQAIEVTVQAVRTALNGPIEGCSQAMATIKATVDEYFPPGWWPKLISNALAGTA